MLHLCCNRLVTFEAKKVTPLGARSPVHEPEPSDLGGSYEHVRGAVDTHDDEEPAALPGRADSYNPFDASRLLELERGVEEHLRPCAAAKGDVLTDEAYELRGRHYDEFWRHGGRVVRADPGPRPPPTVSWHSPERVAGTLLPPPTLSTFLVLARVWLRSLARARTLSQSTAMHVC